MRQLLVLLMLVSTLCFGWEKNNVTIFGDTGSVTAILMTDEASTWGLNGTVETDVVKHGDSSEIYELSNVYNPASVASNLMNFDYYTLETTIGITTTENWNWIIYGGKYWPGPTEFVYPSLVYTTAEYHTATQSATCPSDSTEAAIKVMIPAGTYEVTYEVTAWVKFTSISAYAFLDFGLDGVYPINFLAYNHLLIRPSGLSAQANVTWLGAWDEFASYTGDLGSVWHKITAKFLHHAASNATTGHLTVLVDDDIVIDNAYWSVAVEGATINKHLGSINIIATPGAYIDSMSFTGYDPSMFPNVTTNSMMFKDGEAGPITLKQLRDIEYVRHLYYTKTNLQTTGEALLNAANLFNTSSFTVPDPFHVNHLDVADSSEIYETTYTVPAAPSFFNNFDTGEAGLDVVDTNYSDVSPLYTWQEGVYGGGADYYSLIYCDSVSVSTPHSAGSMNAYTRMLTTAMDTLETGTTWTATVKVYHTPAGVAYFGPTILPYNTSTWQQFQFEVVLQGNNVWLYQGYGGSSLQLWTSASTSALTWHSYTLSVDLGLDKVRLVVDGTTDSGWIDYTFNSDNAVAIKTFTIGGYSDGNWMAFDDVLLSNYRTADPVYYKQLVLADEVNGPRRLSELVNDTVTIASIEAAIDTLNAFRLTCETSIAALEAFRGTAEAKFITIEAAIAAFPSIGTWATLEAMLATHEDSIQALETFRGTAESAIVALQNRDNTQETAIQLNSAEIATIELTINDGMLTSPNVALSPPRTLTWDAFVMWHDGVAYTVASGTQLMTDNAESYLSWDTSTHSMTLVSSPPETEDGIQVAHAAFQTNEVIDFAGEETISDLYPHTFHALQEILKVNVVEGLNVYPDTDATSTLDLTMASGEYYHGANHMHEQVSNINTRTTPMKVWYHNSSGDWSYYYNSNVDPNVYDTGTGTAAVTTNKYSKRLFMYASGEVNSVLPTSIYNTEAEGLSANLPAFPPGLVAFPKSTSLVIRQGSTTLPTYPSNYWKDERPMTGGNSSSVSGVTSHSGLTNLTADDHTIYALLAGRSGGQTLYGGTAASDNITIESTSNATKGFVNLQPNGGNVGIGIANPTVPLHVGSGTGVANRSVAYFSGAVTPGAAFASGVDIRDLTLNPGAGQNAAGLYMAPTLVVPASGTSALFNTARFSAPSITAGAGAVTLASTVYVGGEPSGATTNNALHVASGKSYFGGNVGVNTTSPQGKVDITSTDSTPGLMVRGTTAANNSAYFTSAGYGPVVGTEASGGTYYSFGVASGVTPTSGGFTGGTMRFVVKDDGKTGVNTSTPAAALDVVGAANIGTSAAVLGTTELQVKGQFYVDGVTAGKPQIVSTWNVNGANYFHLVDNGTNGMYFGASSSTATVPTTPALAIGTDGAYLARVGIGTTSPRAKLNIYNDAAVSASGQDVLILEAKTSGATAGSGPILRFGDDSFANTMGYIRASYDAASTASLRFGTGYGLSPVDRMTITNAGNVGIGTASPGDELTVCGEISGRYDATYPTTGSGFWQIDTNNTDADSGGMTILYNNNGTMTEAMRINETGKVGIGTASPAAKLEIMQADTRYDSSAGIDILKLSNTATNGDPIFLLGADNTSNIAFAQGVFRNTSWLCPISLQPNGGNVGIGDVSPTRNLTVTTTGNTDAMIKTGNTTGYGYLYFGDTGADGRGWVGYYHTDDALYLGSAGATRLTIDSSGRWLNDNLAVNDNEIWENVTDADTGALYMNYRGYAAGTTKYRDFYICNGKAGYLLSADGSTGGIGLGGVTAPDGVLDIVTDTGTTGAAGVRENVGNATATTGTWTRGSTAGSTTQVCTVTDNGKLANNSTLEIFDIGNSGFAEAYIILASNGDVGIYKMAGATVTAISAVSNVTTTKATANKVNIYGTSYSAGFGNKLWIENLTGSDAYIWYKVTYSWY